MQERAELRQAVWQRRREREQEGEREEWERRNAGRRLYHSASSVASDAISTSCTEQLHDIFTAWLPV